MKTKDGEDYVDMRQAARLLGVNQRAVRHLVARGRLDTKREGVAGRLMISVASVESFDAK